MKKIYLLALSAMFGLSAMAQVSVTFQVDMNGQTVSPNGVHVAGDWQSEAGFPEDWQPGTAQMTDDNADGIYSLTVNIPTGQYEYKFINGNSWGTDEGVPQINKTGISDNRFIMVTDYHATGGFTVPAVMFAGSAPAGEVAVRLSVDMSTQDGVSENGLHVAGTLFAEEWEPLFGAMFPSADSIYVYVANVAPDATYSYKFINGNAWDFDEWAGGVAPDECTDGGNRTVDVTSDNVTVSTVCYEACDPCTPPLPQTEVTFKVNLSLQGGGNPDGISVAGSFQGWAPGATLMTDDDGDDIYEVTLMVDQGTQYYKFLNGLSWGTEEVVPTACNIDNNREIVVGEDAITVEYCFNQCTTECIVDLDPSDITFRVNMTDTIVSTDGVWVMGSFTQPNWKPGAIQMTDADADGIYEVTVTGVSGPSDIQYKFANGDVNTQEEIGNFIEGGCGVSNGLQGWNRTLIRTGEPMVLDVVCYNACVNCDLVGLEEIGLGEVTLFPNPSNGVTYLDVQNPKGYTLTMSIVDITGKTVRENVVLNSTRNEINTKNLNAGLYFLNIVNEQSDRSVYKLIVR